MANQAPIKVSGETKERIRYLAALTDATQAEIVDRAVEEYAARHADAINEGIDRARLVLAGGDAAIAAHLLDVPAEDIQRIAGKPASANAGPARPLPTSQPGVLASHPGLRTPRRGNGAPARRTRCRAADRGRACRPPPGCSARTRSPPLPRSPRPGHGTEGNRRAQRPVPFPVATKRHPPAAATRQSALAANG